MIYIITDLHLNHGEPMKWYCQRPDNYEELIARGLNTLTKDDVLICLGDICIGKDAEMHEKYIKPLVCKKWLVKGNHDRKSDNWYLSHGWDAVCETMTLKMYGARILLSHMPQYLLINDHGFELYDINIHGHLHNFNHRNEKMEALVILNHRQKLLAIENTKYKPVSLKSLVEDFNRESRRLCENVSR